MSTWFIRQPGGRADHGFPVGIATAAESVAPAHIRRAAAQEG